MVVCCNRIQSTTVVPLRVSLHDASVLVEIIESVNQRFAKVAYSKNVALPTTLRSHWDFNV